jgi:hypothetical protein
MVHADMVVQSRWVWPSDLSGSAAAPNFQAVFKCMLGSYPLWASTYLGILVGCHQIEDGMNNLCEPCSLICAFTQDRTQLPSLHCCVH